MELLTQLFNRLLQSPEQALELVNSVPPEVWSVGIETVMGAIIVSPLMVGVKKYFSIKAEQKMLALVMLASTVASITAYLVTVPEFAPWIIPIQSAVLFATTQPVYIYLVKPLFRRIGSWFTDQITKATMINEAKAAAVPPEGLSIGGGNLPQ